MAVNTAFERCDAIWPLMPVTLDVALCAALGCLPAGLARGYIKRSRRAKNHAAVANSNLANRCAFNQPDDHAIRSDEGAVVGLYRIRESIMIDRPVEACRSANFTRVGAATANWLLYLGLKASLDLSLRFEIEEHLRDHVLVVASKLLGTQLNFGEVNGNGRHVDSSNSLSAASGQKVSA